MAVSSGLWLFCKKQSVRKCGILYSEDAVSAQAAIQETYRCRKKGNKKHLQFEHFLPVSNYILDLSSFNMHVVHFPALSVFHEPIRKLVAIFGIAAKSLRLLIPQDAGGT